MTKHTRDLRRLISYHEAGHAVAARQLGIDIDDVTMIPGDGKLGNVRTYDAAWKAMQTGSEDRLVRRVVNASRIH